MNKSIFFDDVRSCDLTRNEFVQLAATNLNYHAIMNLRGARLCDIDLRNLHLNNFNFTYCDLRGAKFTGAQLSQSNWNQFEGANIEDAIFDESHKPKLKDAINIELATFI